MAICLGCARAGGKRDDCRDCADVREPSLKEKSDAAVAELTRQFRESRDPELEKLAKAPEAKYL